MRTLLFHRHVESYTGGHGKVLDYLRHAAAHPAWAPQVHVTPGSMATADNPFIPLPERVDAWRPAQAHALFLGGRDWLAVPADVSRPVINLIQHVRHADAHYGLRPFLQRRAVRICVSQAVASAISATGEVRGPTVVIPAAVDTHALRHLGRRVMATADVFIDAVKQPGMGEAVAGALRAGGVTVDLLQSRCPRPDYLARMAAGRIVVTLPDPAEGFYLPGLEAMAMGRTLVQYDCIGSREYLRDGANAKVPPPDAAAISQAVLGLVHRAPACTRLAETAMLDAMAFDLSVERRLFHALLDDLDELWNTSA